MRWQIVIPMSGFGERFRRAGYSHPKPLIEVNGKPIIAHVLNLFPGETDVHFICNIDHLRNKTWNMSGILHQYCPHGVIHAINPHNLGPVNAVVQILSNLDMIRPVAVSYCDFTGHWDWNAFKIFMSNGKYDGAVVCYTGFHPHMLACSKYAYCKTDNKNRILAIQEKQSYTDTPMNEWASCGIYCFASGKILNKAVTETIERKDLRLNGEYYMSLAYRPLLEQGADIRIFPMQRFCQWGTPEDLETWKTQTAAVRLGNTSQTRPALTGATLLPLSGRGNRFAAAGQTTPKPLIPVDGRPMALAAWGDLPRTPQNHFVLRRDMPGADIMATHLLGKVPDARLHWLDSTTDGQARTCLLALNNNDDIDDQAPLTIGACDTGLRYDADAFVLLWKQMPDVVVWTTRGHPGAIRCPEQYGWVDADTSGIIKHVWVKRAPLNPAATPLVTGVFTFRRAVDFRLAAEHMIARHGKINGEYYVDECINDALALGMKVYLFDVRAYLCWGSPDELRTWEYWTCFMHEKGEE